MGGTTKGQLQFYDGDWLAFAHLFRPAETLHPRHCIGAFQLKQGCHGVPACTGQR